MSQVRRLNDGRLDYHDGFESLTLESGAGFNRELRIQKRRHESTMAASSVWRTSWPRRTHRTGGPGAELKGRGCG